MLHAKYLIKSFQKLSNNFCDLIPQNKSLKQNQINLYDNIYSQSIYKKI